jgi:ankyrin repeat protein
MINALLNHEWDKAKDLIYSSSQLEIMATLANGLNSLHIAIQFNQLSISRALLIKGANVNALAQDSLFKNMTPLHFAALLGHHRCVQLLIGWGADRKITNSEGRTAYDVALLAGHRSLAPLLDPAVNQIQVSPILELAKIQRCNNPFIKEMISIKVLELENSTPESKQAIRFLSQKLIASKSPPLQQANVLSFPVVGKNFRSR